MNICWAPVPPGGVAWVITIQPESKLLGCYVHTDFSRAISAAGFLLLLALMTNEKKIE